MNLHRRHLTSSQRAVIALDILPMLEAEAKERQRLSKGRGKKGVAKMPHLIEPKSRDKAAKIAQVSSRYVQDAKKLKQEAPELFEQVRAGEITIPKAKEELKARKAGPSQAVAITVFSSESVEYYTPLQYVEAARQVMGSIDLDPASCEAAQKVIGAPRYYTKEMDGLKQKWEGRVWLNPPYGKIGNASSQGYWGQRLLEEYRDGNVSEAILLVKAATGYEWFEKLWDELPVCFARERLSFIREDGDDDGSSKQGTCFFYLGENVERFVEVFTRFGRIILPEDQR